MQALFKNLQFFFRSLQETFAQLDLDGDGRLSKKEIEKALGNVLSEADFNELLTELDADQSGEVDWQEFVNVMKIRMREPESVKMLKEAFRWEEKFALPHQINQNSIVLKGGKFSAHSLVKALCSKPWLKR